MKKLIAVLALLTSFSVVATDAVAKKQHIDISGTIGVGSDYIFRGVSNNNGNPAAFATIAISPEGYSLADNFEVGAFVSHVDYDDDASYEYDFYAQYGFELTDDIDVLAGIKQVNYNAVYPETEEWYVGMTLANIIRAIYYKDRDTQVETGEVYFLLPIPTKTKFEIYYIDPTDYHGLNISRDLGAYTLLTSIGSEDSMVSIHYNF